MKNPGPVKSGTDLHRAMVQYATELGKSFDISPASALGQLAKLHECLGKAAESDDKMSNLIVSNKTEEVES